MGSNRAPHVISNSSGPFRRTECEFGPVRSGPFREIVDPKKCDSVDSESKSVKRNANHQNRLTVCFYMLL